MRSHTNRHLSTGVLSLAVIAFTMLGTSRPTQAAGIDPELRAGLYPDADAFAIGGGLLAEVGRGGGWYFNPNIDLAFGDSRDLVVMSGDFHYDFATMENMSVWAGLGPSILFVNRDSRGSDTMGGLNLLAGLGARYGQARPFGQIRGTIANDSQIAITGGIRF